MGLMLRGVLFPTLEFEIVGMPKNILKKTIFA